MNILLIVLPAAGGLVSFLIWLLILALIIYVVFLVLGMLPLPAAAKQIITIIIGVIFLLVLLQRLGIVL